MIDNWKNEWFLEEVGGDPMGGKIASQHEAIPQMWTKQTVLPVLASLLMHTSSILAQSFVLSLHIQNSVDWILGGLAGKEKTY